MGEKLPIEIIELNKNSKTKADMIVVVEDILKRIKDETIECFIFSAYDSNNELLTAKGGISSITEEQTLVGALQTMVTIDVIEGRL